MLLVARPPADPERSRTSSVLDDLEAGLAHSPVRQRCVPSPPLHLNVVLRRRHRRAPLGIEVDVWCGSLVVGALTQGGVAAAESAISEDGGIRVGDVIVAANGAEVESIAELKAEVAKSGPAVSLSLVRRPLALVFESTAARMRLSRGGAWAAATLRLLSNRTLEYETETNAGEIPLRDTCTLDVRGRTLALEVAGGDVAVELDAASAAEGDTFLRHLAQIAALHPTTVVVASGRVQRRAGGFFSRSTPPCEFDAFSNGTLIYYDADAAAAGAGGRLGEAAGALLLRDYTIESDPLEGTDGGGAAHGALLLAHAESGATWILTEIESHVEGMAAVDVLSELVE